MSRKSTKIIKIILIVLGSFLALDLTIVGLLFVPPIQNKVVDMVTGMLSEKWHSEIHIGSVYITPTLKAKVNDFAIRDHHGNDMIAAEQLQTRITQLKVSPVHLCFGTIEGDKVKVVVRKYKGDDAVNISIWAKNFAKKKKNPKPFKMNAKSIILKDSYFLYANDEKRLADHGNEMDYAFFEIKDIDWNLNQFGLIGSDISADFERMSFKQYSGFQLMDLVCKFHISGNGLSMKDATLITPTSRVYMDFAFDYDTWKDFGDFLNKIKINADVRPSTFDTRDIGFFAPKTAGMDNLLSFQCKVSGPINDLKINDLDAHFGESTHLIGNLSLQNITDFFNADIHAKLEKNEINLADIQQFKLPNGKTIALPDFLKNLGTATADIAYDGIISRKFTAVADVNTAAGQLSANIDAAPHVDDDGVDYVADVQSSGINIRKLFPKAKLFGHTAMHVKAKGQIGDMHNAANTLTADATAHIPHITLKGYSLKNVYAKGTYHGKKLKAEATIRDKNCDLGVSGNVNFAHKRKEYNLEASINHIYANRIFDHLAPIDSNTKDGMEKFIRYVQLHPEIFLAFESAGCSLSGSNLRDLAGNIYIDNIEYQQDNKTFQTERLRLALLPQEDYQTIRFTSDILNATLTTNHELKEIPNKIIDIAYAYCGNLLPERKNTGKICAGPAEGEPTHFLDLEATAYDLEPILSIFVPSIQVGENAQIHIRTDEQHTDDLVSINLPMLSIKDKAVVNNLDFKGKQNDAGKMVVDATVGHILIGEKGNFAFDDITLKSTVGANHLDYELGWQNPAVISDRRSKLGGLADFPSKGVIRTRVTESEVYVKELPIVINDQNLVSINHGEVSIENLILSTLESKIDVNGHVGNGRDSLVAILENVDIDLVNQILKNDKMVLDGNLTANLQVRSRNGRRGIFGTAFVKGFSFNDENFGDLYAAALLPSDKNIHFRGGLINPSFLPEDAGPNNYTYKDFEKQEGINAILYGKFDMEKKELRATADIDTLRLSFIEPFLASFSNTFQGDASGKIDFVLNKDSMYFDGQALVRHAIMGISPLNALYIIENQTIDFDKDGFTFNNMDLKDPFENHATLNGYIHHNKFQDLDLNLSIKTPKILVLNTKQGGESPFYGTGYVSGDVAIYGNTQKLYFSGQNLATEKGTIFGLPISFADKVSESDVITFTVDTSLLVEADNEMPPTSNMEMDFDFTFNVTPAADIKLDLDLSAFGGTIKTKGDGTIHFKYNTKSDINILGDVELQKGSFMMSFANVINKKFELMPGGVVSFGGSLDDININVQAQYSTTAALSDLLGADNANSRQMPVKTFLKFNGNLSDPAAIDFAFEIPNATNDLKNLFYSTIDTTNLQKKTEQFFSLVMLGKFTSSNASTDINLENAGIGILTNTLSNFISQQLKVVDVNLNYQNATADKAAQYSVGASTSLFNDRTVIEGYFGYVDDQNQNNLSSQFIGDFSVEQKLNELGTWRLKVFNVTNQDELRNATRNSPYAQGVAIIYKQDFNNRKDLIASFQRSKKKKKDKIKNKIKE
ncbi:MAG: translocation/assembly module TamB domain-containing protein [Bacteroidales bacterium]|nr:translocation/assembly module TamB domain-containing protein [Bacteroidales bacterium]